MSRIDNCTSADHSARTTALELLPNQIQSRFRGMDLMLHVHIFELEGSHGVSELHGSLASAWLHQCDSDSVVIEKDTSSSRSLITSSSPSPKQTQDYAATAPYAKSTMTLDPSSTSELAKSEDPGSENPMTALLSHSACNWNYGSAGMVLGLQAVTSVSSLIDEESTNVDSSLFMDIEGPRIEIEGFKTTASLSGTPPPSVHFENIALPNDGILITPATDTQPPKSETIMATQRIEEASILVKRSASAPCAPDQPHGIENTRMACYPQRSASSPWVSEQAEKEVIDPEHLALNGVSLYYSSKTQQLVSTPSGRGVTQLTNSQKIRRSLSLTAHASALRTQSVRSVQLVRSFTLKHISSLLKDVPFAALLRSTSLEDTHFEKSVQNLHNTRDDLAHKARPRHRFRGGRMSVSGRGSLMRIAYPDLRCDQCSRIFRGHDRKRKLARHRQKLHRSVSHTHGNTLQHQMVEKCNSGRDDDIGLQYSPERIVKRSHSEEWASHAIISPISMRRRSTGVMTILPSIHELPVPELFNSIAELPGEMFFELPALEYQSRLPIMIPAISDQHDFIDVSPNSDRRCCTILSPTSDRNVYTSIPPSLNIPAFPFIVPTTSQHDCGALSSTAWTRQRVSSSPAPSPGPLSAPRNVIFTPFLDAEIKHTANPSCLEPALNCYRCGDTFHGRFRERNMQRHSRKCSVRYKCRGCEKEFSRMDHRKKHEWKEHGLKDKGSKWRRGMREKRIYMPSALTTEEKKSNKKKKTLVPSVPTIEEENIIT